MPCPGGRRNLNFFSIARSSWAVVFLVPAGRPRCFFSSANSFAAWLTAPTEGCVPSVFVTMLAMLCRDTFFVPAGGFRLLRLQAGEKRERRLLLRRVVRRCAEASSLSLRASDAAFSRSLRGS